MQQLTITGLKAVVLSGLIILTTACQAPPLFNSVINKIALAGSDVDITLKVSGDPNRVTCMGDAVNLSSDDGVNYNGTIPQYLLDVGQNIIHCSASNDGGTFALPVGVVVVIPNIAPAINTVADKSVYDEDGGQPLDINLMANGGENLLAITYSLATGNAYDTLPVGLSLNAQTGHIEGQVDVDGSQSLVLALRASNLAGTDTSNPFTLTINDGSP